MANLIRHTSALLLKPVGRKWRIAVASPSRALSSGSKSEAPKFDDVMVKAYAVMSENHRHERGPWKMMTEKAMFHTNNLNYAPTILDIATGPGEPAKSIAMAMPHSKVIASDVCEDMIATATKNTKDHDNIQCIVADSQDLSIIDSESVDVVTCCYGYMFPTDKPMALSETLRVLKPGGTLIATTWDNVDMSKLCRDIMTKILGEEPPPPRLNPMSLSEEGLFQKLLEEAGFIDVAQTTSSYPFNLGADKEFQFTVGTMLLRDKINEIAESDSGVWKKVEEVFWENIGKYSKVEDGSGGMVMPENTFRLTIAKKA